MALFQVSQRLVKYQQPIFSINSSHGCFSENRATTGTTKTSNFNKIFHSFIILHFGVYIPLFVLETTHQSTGNITPSPSPPIFPASRRSKQRGMIGRMKLGLERLEAKRSTPPCLMRRRVYSWCLRIQRQSRYLGLESGWKKEQFSTTVKCLVIQSNPFWDGQNVTLVRG